MLAPIVSQYDRALAKERLEVVAILDKILRAGEGRALKNLQKIVAEVNSHEATFASMSDEQLRDMTEKFKSRYQNGEDLDSILPEAFAVVREASKRTLGQRHYDVQIMGGAALHLGNIAEMKTGEGKTLVATLPSYLNAITGRGVHIVTTNDYLAERDSEWMGRIHRFLGLKVGVILASMTPAERRTNYAADITYGTNNEFGFDYLRDNMAWNLDDCVQREHHFAIVDEVDSILIDEARTPLIISGPADKATKWYVEFANIATRLTAGEHYEVDEKKRTVGILDSGVARVEELLKIDNLYETVNTPMIGYLNNALKAKELFKRDRDYVVMNGELLIVDEHTGRVLSGRRYSEGLHQALEAKERIEIRDENQTLATITLQNYFRLYEKLAGMTGTAMTEASEFMQIYKLGVIPIPTNKTMQRVDKSDLVYKTELAKFEAVANDIAERHHKGQPVLVGTISVEKSEYLSQILRKRGIAHEVLNAKQNEREAAIVARAGTIGAVTVSTNMAGRGTDIMLGGNPEFMADFELQRQGISPVDNAEQYEAAWPNEIAKQKSLVKDQHEKVVELGGLYVVGTERHESRRIDNQLRGRSGRQGDPGESRFYLSLQDELMRRFNSALVERFLTAAGIPEETPIESKMVSNAIKSAQTQVEAQNFEMRKNVLKYDDVMNRQREVVYRERREVLEGVDISEQVRTFIEDTIRGYIASATSVGYSEEWDLAQLWTVLKAIYPISFSVEELVNEVGGISGLDGDFLAQRIVDDILAAYDEREKNLGSEIIRELERKILLSVLDRKWREHLYEMDYLQEGIGLRAMAQRDPLVEYQKEGYELFSAMIEAMKEEIVGYLFNVEVKVEDAHVDAKGVEEPQRQELRYSAPSETGATTSSANASGSGVSRNAPCPCGSGKKYKRCHGAS